MFVTVTSVAAMLVMASSPAENFELAHKTYSDCVEENHVANIEKNADVSEYTDSLSQVCQTEKKNLFDAVMKFQRSEGATAEEAREYAEEEIQIILEDSAASYTDRAENDGQSEEPEQEG